MVLVALASNVLCHNMALDVIGEMHESAWKVILRVTRCIVMVLQAFVESQVLSTSLSLSSWSYCNTPFASPAEDVVKYSFMSVYASEPLVRTLRIPHKISQFTTEFDISIHFYK